MVCLTFDDGPHPTNTPALLDLLGQYQAKATFFVVGSGRSSMVRCSAGPQLRGML